jgi:hypothetical protein
MADLVTLPAVLRYLESAALRLDQPWIMTFKDALNIRLLARALAPPRAGGALHQEARAEPPPA